MSKDRTTWIRYPSAFTPRTKILSCSSSDPCVLPLLPLLIGTRGLSASTIGSAFRFNPNISRKGAIHFFILGDLPIPASTSFRLGFDGNLLETFDVGTSVTLEGEPNTVFVTRFMRLRTLPLLELEPGRDEFSLELGDPCGFLSCRLVTCVVEGDDTRRIVPLSSTNLGLDPEAGSDRPTPSLPPFAFTEYALYPDFASAPEPEAGGGAGATFP
mmetsp:Transcript_23401/g.37508  ORF Transcript_23401/g.37508 Transcript_23401/m.37508 type:complete len:214 (+) Transcript_23401:433-1074(+)